jgi:hypothetical protein
MGLTIRRRDASTSHELEALDHFGLDPAGVEAQCFCCFERVVHPAIYWVGLEGTIYLHRHCALQLARGLTRDAIRLRPGDADRPAAAA